jgi:hypothetical protein
MLPSILIGAKLRSFSCGFRSRFRQQSFFSAVSHQNIRRSRLKSEEAEADCNVSARSLVDRQNEPRS